LALVFVVHNLVNKNAFAISVKFSSDFLGSVRTFNLITGG
jgi:hypothetical protein